MMYFGLSILIAKSIDANYTKIVKCMEWTTLVQFLFDVFS